MISKEKLKELRQRMMKHDVKDGKAIVIVSARELQELIDIAEKSIDAKEQ